MMKYLYFHVVFTLIFFTGSLWSSAYAHTEETTGPGTEIKKESAKPGRDASIGDNIFVVRDAITNMDDFTVYARILERLKPYGRVDVSINTPALAGTFDIGGPWHEYASYNMAVSAFFPDDMMKPFFPADYTKANRQLLDAKLKVLRKYGLDAQFGSNEPRYLPEAFYEKYPHLRGPRVDHPRRSNQMAFAPCFHQEGTIEMYTRMVDDLFRDAPEINTVRFGLNDAGSGFCWFDWLYTGPNGPSACKNTDKNVAILNMVNLFKEAAKKEAGHDIDIFLRGMLTDEERDHLAPALPERCYLEGRNMPESVNISSMIWPAYPVKGLINPLGIMEDLNRTDPAKSYRFNLGFAGSYHRGTENLETVEKVVEMVADHFSMPATEKGTIPVLQSLRSLCVKWGGEKNADILMKAFVDLDETLRAGRIATPGLSTLYWGVSTRHITRPLVFATDRLSPEEESYFLPYVFNMSEEEARDDYMDIHGGNREISTGSAQAFAGRLKRIATMISTIQDAPEQEYLDHFATSLRIYSSVVRSCGNFNDAQVIRNRHRKELAGPVHRPDKIPTWTGDQDLLDFNAIMRDELDNTQELIDILENGGLDLVVHAKPPFPEDTFLLGADLPDQLKMKRRVMLAHWTDIEGYLKTPFK